MFKMLVNSSMVRFSISTNKFVLFMKSIPLLGKLIPSTLYGSEVLKTILLVIGIIRSVLSNLLFKSLYVAAMLWIPARYLHYAIEELFEVNISIPFMPTFVFLFMVFNWLYGSFVNSSIMSTDEEKFYMIKLLRCEPRMYYLASLAQKLVFDVIGYIIPIGLFLLLETDGKHGFLTALYLILIQECFRVMMEALCMKLYQACRYDAGQVNPVKILLGILVLPVAIAVPVLTDAAPVLWTIISNPVFGAVCVAAGVLSWLYLGNYKKYNNVAFKTLTYSRVLTGMETRKNAAAGEKQAGVRYNDKAMKKQKIDEGRFAGKEGYDFLNAVFFDRHSYKIRKGWLIRLGIVSAIILAFALVILVSGGIEDMESERGYVSIMLGAFLFSFYVLNSVETTCKLMFYHCDRALLKYGFYREPGALLKCYMLRLRKILSMDILLALLADAGLVFILTLNGTFDFTAIWPVIVGIPLEMMFIDMFRLMMYYVFQPFCEQAQIKSAMYRFCSIVLYVFCYSGCQVRDNSFIYAGIVLGVCVVFIPLSQVLVYKLAPKGFRLKD